MASYYINKDTSNNPNHDHEVHKEGCIWMPSAVNREYLGVFASGVEAVAAARRKGYTKVDGCKTCCSEAHHG